MITRVWRTRKPLGERGAVGIMAGVIAVPMIMFTGLAVDATLVWLLRQHLQWSVDTASLLGASQMNYTSTSKVVTDTQAMFWANFGAQTVDEGTGKKGFLGATAQTPTVNATTTTVTISATATLPTVFMQMVLGSTSSTITATGVGAVPRNVEVALALDNSLSMGLALDGTGQTKLAALKIAAKNMVDTLFGTSTVPGGVYMSIVPFAGAVNVGSGNTAFVNPVALAAKFTGSGNGAWRGCVEARATPNDTTDATPATAAFAPYYYASTMGDPQKTVRPASLGGGLYPGDNDWGPALGVNVTDTAAASETSNVNYLSPGSGSTNPATLQVGPNLFCPHNALTKPTNASASLKSAIDALTIVNGGGTIINQGLQWAWLTLSPLWQAQWGLPNTSSGLARPRQYTDATNTKVVILMTDGMNEIDGINSFYGFASSGGATNCGRVSAANQIWPECFRADSWYSSYGRLSSNTLVTPGASTAGNAGSVADTARTAAQGVLSTRMQTLCNNAKAKGLIIYTIFYHGPQDDSLLGAAASNAGPNLKACATDAAHYFDSTSATAINAAFVQIARDIANLRLTQ